MLLSSSLRSLTKINSKNHVFIRKNSINPLESKRELKISVFSARNYDRSHLSKENEKRNNPHDLKFFEGGLNTESVQFTKDSDAVCLFVNDDASKEVLKKLKENGTKLILMRCAGTDNVDMECAKELGISVKNVPEYSPHAVAEFAVGLVLALSRKIHKAYNRVRDQNFELDGLKGMNIHGKTVGVMGTGRIGMIFATIMNGFGVKLIGYDPKKNQELLKKLPDFEYVTKEECLSRSDIISLHLPLVEDTIEIINKETISKMKDGVMLINTSRGHLINPEDADQAIRSGKIGMLALDVHKAEKEYFFHNKEEKVIQDRHLNSLLQYPNVIVTSHQAFFTQEALNNISETVFNNAKEFEKNGK